MADYTWLDLMRACRNAGFVYGQGLVTAFAVSAGEDTSRLLDAKFVNTDGSVDRGPWQFNSKWHSEVSDACAFDLACSTKEAYRVSKQGSSFSAWSGYTNGRYRQFVDLGSNVYQLDVALRSIAALDVQVQQLEAALSKDDADLADARQQITALSGTIATLQAKISKAQADLA